MSVQKTLHPTRPQMIEGSMPHPGIGNKATGETAIYRLTDRDGRLLYVGMSRNPLMRWAWHAEQHPWWGEVAAYSVEWLPDRADAEAEERRAIKDDQPVHNIHSTPRHGPAVMAGSRRTAEAYRSSTSAG